MTTDLGLMQIWQDGDGMTRAVAIALFLLSLASWSTMLAKVVAHWRQRPLQQWLVSHFWQTDSLASARRELAGRDPHALFLPLVDAGAAAADRHRGAAPAHGIDTGLSLNEALSRALRNALIHSQSRLESGLTLLATIGATAPFVGLLGTVWGIHHALTGLRGSAQVALDQVAGPVGEALVMTAAGLFVALPAVLAYNAFTRINRLTLVRLDSFAHDLHSHFIHHHGRPAEAR
jgi:biopolymer transport protein ExbB